MSACRTSQMESRSQGMWERTRTTMEIQTTRITAEAPARRRALLQPKPKDLPKRRKRRVGVIRSLPRKRKSKVGEALRSVFLGSRLALGGSSTARALLEVMSSQRRNQGVGTSGIPALGLPGRGAAGFSHPPPLVPVPSLPAASYDRDGGKLGSCCGYATEIADSVKIEGGDSPPPPPDRGKFVSCCGHATDIVKSVKVEGDDSPRARSRPPPLSRLAAGAQDAIFPLEAPFRGAWLRWVELLMV